MKHIFFLIANLIANCVNVDKNQDDTFNFNIIKDKNQRQSAKN